MTSIKVNIKWGKEIFKDLEIDPNSNAEEFRAQVYSLSMVNPSRQKIIYKGKQLKDDQWEQFVANLSNGATLMLIGSADSLTGPKEKVIFAEDLPPEELEGALSNLPPGLVNLGNTCYMNSVIQTLATIPELESTIKNASHDLNSNDISVSTLGALKSLINQLKSSKVAFKPIAFLLTLHKNFPQFAERRNGFLMQQDAEECWTQLVHCLKKLPSGNDEKSLYQQLFEGEMIVSYRNLESDEPVESTAQTFDKLSCHINKNVNYLSEGLELSLQEKIEKNSPHLNKICNYEKISKISRLPYYIPVQFVRFFWRTDTQTKAKIVRPVEFPLELDVYEYCTDELKAQLQSNRAKIQEKKENEKIEQKPFTNETGLYQLKAVISHKSRDADAGHYVAWVHVSGDDWLLFDDDKVSKIKVNEIEKLSGKGGGDWHIAYLCLYKSKEF